MQNNTAVQIEESVIPFSVITANSKKKEVKFTKEGKAKLTRNNKQAGKSSEVFALKSTEEIKRIVSVLNRKIDEAHDKVNETYGEKPMPITQLRNAYRNKMIWLVGMNIGIRASDFLELKWSFFFDVKDDSTIEWKPYYSLIPQKQRKKHKFVKLYFNNTLKQAIMDYLKMYPITQKQIDDYMFTNDRGEHITKQQLWNIIKDTAAEAGIEQNVGTHSLRKTWGYHCWHNATDKSKALIILQKCFGHSSPQTTLAYIGILNEEIEDMYLSVELGAEDI